jgi:hypothetical protein
MSTASDIELTIFTKAGGPLTKRIALNGDGTIHSDGSACVMSKGIANRVKIDGVDALAATIAKLRFDQAIALGMLRADLPDQVTVTTKGHVNAERSDLIARTGNDVVYEQGRHAFVLLDYDTKGMPADVANRVAAHGGYWNALVAVVPVLERAAHIIRASTSAGLMRTDTGASLTGSGGLHAYVIAQDGRDAVRFLTALHERCWLAGLGWMVVGTAGQLLERSIVDRMVGQPERLVFEGPPVLEPPLTQDAESRRPKVVTGETIDTIAACPPLSLVEQQKLRKLRAEASQALVSEATKARDAYVTRQAQLLAERTGVSRDAAFRVIESQCKGTLLADVTLAFDDPELSNITVADVLDDPARYDGMTLADPIEGIAYGACKAKIMRGFDGTPWINSFAHGRTRIITAALIAAREEHTRQRAAEMRRRRLAERTDPRPQIDCPPPDAPWLTQMDIINEVISRSPMRKRLRRDVDGTVARKRRFAIPGTHAFSSSSDADDEDDNQ